ncbi:MAG: Mur ligase domain-containing protein, partial [Candidatus Omnitrophota bacterium]
MKFSDIPEFAELLVDKAPPVTFSGVQCDSRRVKPGDLFVAIKGIRDEGCKYAGVALAKGAVAVVSETPLCDCSKHLVLVLAAIRIVDTRSMHAFEQTLSPGDRTSQNTRNQSQIEVDVLLCQRLVMKMRQTRQLGAEVAAAMTPVQLLNLLDANDQALLISNLGATFNGFAQMTPDGRFAAINAAVLSRSGGRPAGTPEFDRKLENVLAAVTLTMSKTDFAPWQIYERLAAQHGLAASAKIEYLKEALKSIPADAGVRATIAVALSLAYQEQARPFSGTKKVALLEEALRVTPQGPARQALEQDLGKIYYYLGRSFDYRRQPIHAYYFLSRAASILGSSFPIPGDQLNQFLGDHRAAAQAAEQRILGQVAEDMADHRVTSALSRMAPALVELEHAETVCPLLAERFAEIYHDYHLPGLDCIYQGTLRDERLVRLYDRLFQSVYTDPALAERSARAVNSVRLGKAFTALINSTVSSDTFFETDGLITAQLIPAQALMSPLAGPYYTQTEYTPEEIQERKQIEEDVSSKFDEVMNRLNGDAARYARTKKGAKDPELWDRFQKAAFSKKMREKVIQAMAARIWAGSNAVERQAALKAAAKKMEDDLADIFRVVVLNGGWLEKIPKEITDLQKTTNEKIKTFLTGISEEAANRIEEVSVIYVPNESKQHSNNLRGSLAAFFEGAGVMVIPLPVTEKDGKKVPMASAELTPGLFAHELLHAIGLDYAHHDMREGLTTYFAEKIAVAIGDPSGAQIQHNLYARSKEFVESWLGQNSGNPNFTEKEKKFFQARFEGSFDRVGIYGIREAVAFMQRKNIRTVKINNEDVSLTTLRTEFEHFKTDDEDNPVARPIFVSFVQQGNEWHMVGAENAQPLDIRVTRLTNSQDFQNKCRQTREFIAHGLERYFERFRRGRASFEDERRIVAEARQIDPVLGGYVAALIRLKDRKGDRSDQDELHNVTTNLNNNYLSALGFYGSAEFDAKEGLMFFKAGQIIDRTQPLISDVLGAPVESKIVADLASTEFRGRDNAQNNPDLDFVVQFRNTIIGWADGTMLPISSGEKVKILAQLRSEFDKTIRNSKAGELQYGENFYLDDFGNLRFRDLGALRAKYPHAAEIFGKLNSDVWSKPIMVGKRKVRHPEHIGQDQDLLNAIFERIDEQIKKAAEETTLEQTLMNCYSTTTAKTTLYDVLYNAAEVTLHEHEAMGHKRDDRYKFNGQHSLSSQFKDQEEREFSGHITELIYPTTLDAMGFSLYKFYGNVRLGTSGLAYKKVCAEILSGLTGVSREKLMEGNLDEFKKMLKALNEMSKDAAGKLKIQEKARQMRDTFLDKFTGEGARTEGFESEPSVTSLAPTAPPGGGAAGAPPGPPPGKKKRLEDAISEALEGCRPIIIPGGPATAKSTPEQVERAIYNYLHEYSEDADYQAVINLIEAAQLGTALKNRLINFVLREKTTHQLQRIEHSRTDATRTDAFNRLDATCAEVFARYPDNINAVNEAVSEVKQWLGSFYGMKDLHQDFPNLRRMVLDHTDYLTAGPKKDYQGAVKTCAQLIAVWDQLEPPQQAKVVAFKKACDEARTKKLEELGKRFAQGSRLAGELPPELMDIFSQQIPAVSTVLGQLIEASQEAAAAVKNRKIWENIQTTELGFEPAEKAKIFEMILAMQAKNGALREGLADLTAAADAHPEIIAAMEDPVGILLNEHFDKNAAQVDGFFEDLKAWLRVAKKKPEYKRGGNALFHAAVAQIDNAYLRGKIAAVCDKRHIKGRRILPLLKRIWRMPLDKNTYSIRLALITRILATYDLTAKQRQTFEAYLADPEFLAFRQPLQNQLVSHLIHDLVSEDTQIIATERWPEA